MTVSINLTIVMALILGAVVYNTIFNNKEYELSLYDSNYEVTETYKCTSVILYDRSVQCNILGGGAVSVSSRYMLEIK